METYEKSLSKKPTKYFAAAKKRTCTSLLMHFEAPSPGLMTFLVNVASFESKKRTTSNFQLALAL